jgi:DNA-directed RNA polymerase subunit RPC12/RpoP
MADPSRDGMSRRPKWRAGGACAAPPEAAAFAADAGCAGAGAGAGEASGPSMMASRAGGRLMCGGCVCGALDGRRRKQAENRRRARRRGVNEGLWSQSVFLCFFSGSRRCANFSLTTTKLHPIMLGAAPQLAPAPGVAYLCGDCGAFCVCGVEGWRVRVRGREACASAAAAGASFPFFAFALASRALPCHTHPRFVWSRTTRCACASDKRAGPPCSGALCPPCAWLGGSVFCFSPPPHSPLTCTPRQTPGHENELKAGDVIRCRECGYRILYKKRTKRVVQFEAR